jgi:deoxycytidylate deaminase
LPVPFVPDWKGKCHHQDIYRIQDDQAAYVETYPTGHCAQKCAAIQVGEIIKVEQIKYQASEAEKEERKQQFKK